MNLPSSPNLLEVIRLLLQRVEGSSYPNLDPTSVEDLKAHLRCRIAELEVTARKKHPSLEAAKRNTAAWQAGDGRTVSIAQNPDHPLQGPNENWPIPDGQSHDLS
jgi:hypothetical protein